MVHHRRHRNTHPTLSLTLSEPQALYGTYRQYKSTVTVQCTFGDVEPPGGGWLALRAPAPRPAMALGAS